MHPSILAYNAGQSPADRRICTALAKAIDAHFANQPGAECKVWHRHPVWFLDGNPIVGYHKLKGPVACIRLLFWSGQSFDEPAASGLAPAPPGTKFKTAAAHYTAAPEINAKDLKRWLTKSINIQWDYKNLVKRKGKLVRLK
ncbi:MAG: DUF1801 domain-containing protein [Phycisphaerales bacterium]